jgi:TfoX/Sxy family transcriptional regulator of competence genes
MDKFERQDEKAAALFEEIIRDIACERRKMFGYSVGFINGNMFAGVFADRLFFRVRPEEQEGLKAEIAGLADFEPMRGRRMKEYLEIRAEAGSLPVMKRLAGIAEAAASGLPPKEKKKK